MFTLGIFLVLLKMHFHTPLNLVFRKVSLLGPQLAVQGRPRVKVVQ